MPTKSESESVRTLLPPEKHFTGAEEKSPARGPALRTGGQLHGISECGASLPGALLCVSSEILTYPVARQTGWTLKVLT